nr:MFS transporter [Mesorhizobium sp.]
MSNRRLPLVAAVYLGTFVALLDISIVNVALPTIQIALGIDFAGLQWVIDAYTLCLSAFMLSAGLIGDRYGRKRSWLAGIGISWLALPYVQSRPTCRCCWWAGWCKG